MRLQIGHYGASTEKKSMTKKDGEIREKQGENYTMQ